MIGLLRAVLVVIGFLLFFFVLSRFPEVFVFIVKWSAITISVGMITLLVISLIGATIWVIPIVIVIAVVAVIIKILIM